MSGQGAYYRARRGAVELTGTHPRLDDTFFPLALQQSTVLACSIFVLSVGIEGSGGLGLLSVPRAAVSLVAKPPCGTRHPEPPVVVAQSAAKGAPAAHSQRHWPRGAESKSRACQVKIKPDKIASRCGEIYPLCVSATAGCVSLSPLSLTAELS